MGRKTRKSKRLSGEMQREKRRKNSPGRRNPLGRMTPQMSLRKKRKLRRKNPKREMTPSPRNQRKREGTPLTIVTMNLRTLKRKGRLERKPQRGKRIQRVKRKVPRKNHGKK